MWRWIDGTEFGFNNWASAEQVFFNICILTKTIFYNNFDLTLYEGIKKASF